jgi:uncharacterized protein (TIGR03067 family)
VSRLLAALLVAPVAAMAAPALKARPAPPDAVQGEWVAERTVLGGKDVTRAVGPFKYTFGADGEWLYHSHNSPAGPARHTYTTAPAADPKAGGTIDLQADPAGPAQRTLHGLYRVEGDTLTLCYPNEPTAPRPTGFDSPDGSDIFLVTFKRAERK